MFIKKHLPVSPPFLSCDENPLRVLLGHKMVVQSFPKRLGRGISCKFVSIIEFLLEVNSVCDGVFFIQSWHLLWFVFNMFFFTCCPSFPLRPEVKLPAPALGALKGCCFIHRLPVFVRMVPYQGSQGEAKTENPTATALLINFQTRLNTALDFGSLHCWSSTEPVTYYNS